MGASIIGGGTRNIDIKYRVELQFHQHKVFKDTFGKFYQNPEDLVLSLTPEVNI